MHHPWIHFILFYINYITKSYYILNFTILSDDTTLYFEKISTEILNCQTVVKDINNWLIYNRFLLFFFDIC